MGAIARELQVWLSRLRPEQRLQVLADARALSERPPRGVPGPMLLRFAGTLSEAEAQEFNRVIEEGRETVDPGW